MGVCRRGTGFSLREKLAEFKYGLGKAKKLFFWGKRNFRFASAVSCPQKGVWGMNAGRTQMLSLFFANRFDAS